VLDRVVKLLGIVKKRVPADLAREGFALVPPGPGGQAALR